MCVDILVTLANIRHLLLGLPAGREIYLTRITTTDLEHLRGGRDTSHSLQAESGTLGIPAVLSKIGLTTVTQVVQFGQSKKYRQMKKIEITVSMKSDGPARVA